MVVASSGEGGVFGQLVPAAERHGRAVVLGCRELFGLEYSPENFAEITDALRACIAGKSAAEAYDYFVREKANTRWVLNDGHTYRNDPAEYADGAYPEYYRFTWRMDSMWGS